MTFFEFASNNPWLTFFLALVVGDVIVKVASAFSKKSEKKPVKPMMVK